VNVSEEMLEAGVGASPKVARQRPYFRSLRRELWENRFVSVGPLVVACVVVFATLISTMVTLSRSVAKVANPGIADVHSAVFKGFSVAPAPIMFASFLVGFFYCIDALYGERRDRSILFWKSLPLSDRTVVLAKMSVPMMLLPLIALALSIAVQAILLVATTLALGASGVPLAPAWDRLHFFTGIPIMVYGLTVHALWFAPIYGWLLLVSAWSRRAPIVWAVLPVLAIGIVERIVFSSSHWAKLLGYRFTGAMKEGFDFKSKAHEGDVTHYSQLLVANFLTTPGLWLGLAFAALCLAGAVRMRQLREPV
jgi:ABC-2 type transport system permease protein